MKEAVACNMLCDGTKTKSNLISLKANGFGGGAKSSDGERVVGQTVLPYRSRRNAETMDTTCFVHAFSSGGRRVVVYIPLVLSFYLHT
jgi:hypothetical protein